MKKFCSSILILLFVQQLSAFTFYDQLCNFNFNWKKYEMRAPAGEARHFNSDKEYIQAHLMCVLNILRNNPVDQLNTQQLKSRLHLIEVLDAYRVAGNFPMNYYRNYRTPVFIDENKTHCAVGYLLQQSGHEDIARRISENYQYEWLKDIHDPELPAWQEASGFTMEELELIQGGYFNYRPDAFYAVDKYETPQKPTVILVYFQNEALGKPMSAKPENVWLQGEGKNGVLNGKWIQNSGVGMPWIVGYYENGQRTGQWEEYFQGTKQLCRTENWRNNKLNGIRKRFDRYGNLIEEILFKDGAAVSNTNYSLEDSLTYIRKPIDSTEVATEVYNYEGLLIAFGHEKIFNPGNLQWYQNIELTALNSASIRASDPHTANQISNGNNDPFLTSTRHVGLFSQTPLVQYLKEGDWIYYKEYNYAARKNPVDIKNPIVFDYHHFGSELVNSIRVVDNFRPQSSYDSIRINYSDNYVKDFYGYGVNDFTHLSISYYDPNKVQGAGTLVLPLNNGYSYPGFPINLPVFNSGPVVKECGFYNAANEKIGEWKHFTTDGEVYKTENYLVAWKEDE